jgi:hypothetical protein
MEKNAILMLGSLLTGFFLSVFVDVVLGITVMALGGCIAGFIGFING